jgi:hypothetical protein
MMLNPAEVKEVIALVASTGAFILAWPLVRALAERIRTRPTAAETGLREELRAMREELLGEVETHRGELAQLGERMDFAERLLARQRDAERLAPPAH